MYFVSTSGGTAKGPDNDGFGQLWHYKPGDGGLQDGDQLVLVFESSSDRVLESPDNFCLTPRGGIVFCEDDAVGGTPDEYAAFIKSEIAKWQKVIRDAGVKAE